jgi:hypothetical protein
LYPAADRVDLNAGHCPHDEVPDEVNNAILKFVQTVEQKQKQVPVTQNIGSRSE